MIHVRTALLEGFSPLQRASLATVAALVLAAATLAAAVTVADLVIAL